MRAVTCGSCRAENQIGAALCLQCGRPLAARAIRRAMGSNPLAWLRATALGQILPFVLLGVLLLAAVALGPAPAAWRQLLLTLGLVGLVTIGVIFPLLKGQYDLSAGPVAGLAACCAAAASPYGYWVSLAAALGVGAVVGLINGLVVGWTRISSALVTAITGAVALQVIVGYVAHTELVVTDPFLVSLGETDVQGVPVVLVLFLLALALARVLLNQPFAEAVSGATGPLSAAALSAPRAILLTFCVSGLMAGVAGLLIACCGLTNMGLAGQVLWVLTPLAAALIGGASISNGTGNIRNATVGAAIIAVTNWLCVQLRMPVAGPIAECPYLLIGLLTDRSKCLTWYMVYQAWHGNLLALPDNLRLPAVVWISRGRSRVAQLASLVALLAIGASIYVFIAFYAVQRAPAGTMTVTNVTGIVEVTRAGARSSTPVAAGDSLRAGDTLTVGSASEAMLKSHDGSEVRLDANAELRVSDLSTGQDGTPHTDLSMASGSLFAKVHKLLGRRGAFTVETPVLTLGVRGTAFQVTVGRRTGDVAVAEGQVDIQQQIAVEDASGHQRILADNRTVDAGQALEARPETPLATLVRELDDSEKVELQQAAEAVAAETERVAVGKIRASWWDLLVVMLVVLYLWFVFICCQPAPFEYMEDIIARRIVELEQAPTKTRGDMSSHVALAQMLMRTGDTEGARRYAQKVMDADPNGESGQWARRFLRELGTGKPK